MPRLSTRAESTLRLRAMQADRARGFTLRQVAKLHGCSKTYVHWATRHVPVELVHRRWHLARWCKPDPPGLTVRQVHEHRAGSWGAP